MNHVFIVGAPGCGKTTLVKKVIAHFSPWKKAGFFTEEIREGGERAGFSLETLDGQRGTLAHISFKKGPKVGRYRIDVEVLEDLAADALYQGRKDADLIVIDEVGKMELHSDLLKMAISDVLDSSQKILGTLGDFEDDFIEEIRLREDVFTFKMDTYNQEEVFREVVKMLEGAYD